MIPSFYYITQLISLLPHLEIFPANLLNHPLTAFFAGFNISFSKQVTIFASNVYTCKTSKMKKEINLIATVDKPEVLEDIIEQLATRHYELGYMYREVPSNWHAIDPSSVETYMSGIIEFDYNETQRIRIPYITCFLFTCIKEKNSSYDLNWSCSLS